MDSKGTSYFLIGDNGTNLWIGATSTAGVHHTGGTMISTGYDENGNGKPTIAVSIPNKGGGGGTNYNVLHKGNYASEIGNASASANGLMASAVYNQLFYKARDTQSGMQHASGVITGGGNNLQIYIPAGKSLQNVSGVTCTGLTIAMRAFPSFNDMRVGFVSSGVYVGGAADYNAQSMIVACSLQKATGSIYLNIQNSSGWGLPNNLPIIGTINATFTFS